MFLRLSLFIHFPKNITYIGFIVSNTTYKEVGGLSQDGIEFYRYGFQGQERDNEIKGNGNSINYKYRMHDPRLGRFFAVDPLTSKYPHYTPYSFSGNKVIHAVELEGLEENVVTAKQVDNGDGTTSFEQTGSTAAHCAECPNFQGLNGKGKYGTEYTATMLDGSTQSNYLETVTVTAEPYVAPVAEKTEAPKSWSQSFGDAMRAADNWVMGVARDFEYSSVGKTFKEADIAIQEWANTIEATGIGVNGSFQLGKYKFGLNTGLWGNDKTHLGFYFDPSFSVVADYSIIKFKY